MTVGWKPGSVTNLHSHLYLYIFYYLMSFFYHCSKIIFLAIYKAKPLMVGIDEDYFPIFDKFEFDFDVNSISVLS